MSTAKPAAKTATLSSAGWPRRGRYQRQPPRPFPGASTAGGRSGAPLPWTALIHGSSELLHDGNWTPKSLIQAARPPGRGAIVGLFRLWWPQRDSNPRLGLERASPWVVISPTSTPGAAARCHSAGSSAAGPRASAVGRSTRAREERAEDFQFSPSFAGIAPLGEPELRHDHRAPAASARPRGVLRVQLQVSAI